jgi:hypothetical protein
MSQSTIATHVIPAAVITHTVATIRGRATGRPQRVSRPHPRRADRTDLGRGADAHLVLIVFVNSETEDICRELRLRPDPADASLRQHLDAKIDTTRLGNEAGAPSVSHLPTRSMTGRVCLPWPKRPVLVANSSCRRRTAIPARRRSSSRQWPIGASTAPTLSARRSR